MVSNIRQMPPVRILAEAPTRLGLHVTMVQLAVYADLTPRLRQIGVTSPSRRTALAHIAGTPGCTQSELAHYTGLSRAAAMTMVDQLEAAGFVKRRAGQDGRSNALHVTDAGRRAMEAIEAETTVSEEAVFGCLAPEERDTLRALLERVIRHVAANREPHEKNRSRESKDARPDTNPIADFRRGTDGSVGPGGGDTGSDPI